MSSPIEEPHVLARTSLFPKRKPVLSSVTTRTRFVKPRPNVSVKKIPKESLPVLPENSLNMEKMTDIEYSAVKSQLSPQPAINFSSVSDGYQESNSESLLNMNEVVNKAFSAGNSQLSPQPAINFSSISENHQESAKTDNDVSSPLTEAESELIHRPKILKKAAPIPTLYRSRFREAKPNDGLVVNESTMDNSQSDERSITLETKTMEFHTEENSNSVSPINGPASELSLSHEIEQSLTSPKANIEAISEEENDTASVVNQYTEYSALKDILNSPRKKSPAKKWRERRKRVANFSSTPPRSEMTMVDLLYWNPSSSPMKDTKTTTLSKENLLPADDPAPVTEETENSDAGPKVIINDDGEIILDEASLFVRRNDTIDYSIAAVVEDDNTTYSSFRNRPFKSWPKRETFKFYKALSLVGTDFALMENIFKEDGEVTRTRRELRLKYKREEKRHPKFVHTAIYELQTYNLNILDENLDIELSDESEIIDDAPKQAKSSISDDNEEVLPIKNRKVAQILSEEEDGSIDTDITLKKNLVS